MRALRAVGAVGAPSPANGGPTLDEIKGWPAAVDVRQVGAVLGISRSHCYELIRRGEFPVRVIRLGNHRYRAVTADLVRLLSAASGDPAA